MPMDRNEFLNAIIDDGIEEVRQRFTKVSQALRRDGAMSGFEACRGQNDQALLDLLEKAETETTSARSIQSHNYWYYREREAQIEWTLNVLSASMQEHGQAPLITPTVRGLCKAADILGV